MALFRSASGILQESHARAALLAALLVSAAFLIRSGLNMALATYYIFGVFYVAIALAAYLGRLRCGLYAVVFSAMATGYLILEDARYSSIDLLEWLIFVTGSGIICLLLHKCDAAARNADESRSILNALLEALPVGVALFDRDMRYVLINEQLAKMDGLPVAGHIGKSPGELRLCFAEQVREPFERALAGHGELFVELDGETPGSREVRTWREFWFGVPMGGEHARFVGVVVEDVTDERRAREALADANRRKEETLAFISHELRNPLGVMVNAHRLLASGPVLPSQERPLAMIDRQVKFTRRVLEDLLDIARLNTGKVNLVRQSVDLRTLLRDAAEVVEAGGKQQAIVLELPEDPVVLSVDAQRLRQVVINLLGNASKFSPSGTDICLSLREAAGEVRISVRDHGEGLSPEDLTRVFRKWEQLHGGDRSGLGLGLALVKGLVELHGGRVEAHSDGLGTGCRFTVVLPREALGAA